MKIFEEREELYRQMEKERDQSNRLSISSKGPKNQSVGPIVRSHHMLTETNASIPQKQLINNVQNNPYNNGMGQ